MSQAEDEVLAANARFYAVFVASDLVAMDAFWARRVAVAVCHPGWQPIHGRDRVLRTFREIFEGGAPPVRMTDPHVTLLGTTAAFVVCFERVGDSVLAATNVFVREDGAWRMAQHHAGLVAVDAAAREPEAWN